MAMTILWYANQMRCCVAYSNPLIALSTAVYKPFNCVDMQMKGNLREEICQLMHIQWGSGRDRRRHAISFGCALLLIAGWLDAVYPVSRNWCELSLRHSGNREFWKVCVCVGWSLNADFLVCDAFRHCPYLSMSAFICLVYLIEM